MTGNILADKIGLSRHAIMDYESDATEPALEDLRKISFVLDVNLDKLCDDYYLFLNYPYSTKVKEIRTKMGFTQKKFGILFGVNRRTVERWESGKHCVTREVYYRFIKMKLN